MGTDGSGVREQLKLLNDELVNSFKAKRRVMSYAEYLELCKNSPRQQLRSSPQIVKDCFDHWGHNEVSYPGGNVRRFHLFDCPWSNGRDSLLGQEAVQNSVYGALCNFVSEGAANKLVLLHGPNGSAKSTFVRCLGRALQAYSNLDEGAMYRFNWIFPKKKLSRSDIGFSGTDYADTDVSESFAHLPDELIDARITDNLRDHPLLLLPIDVRKKLSAGWLEDDGHKERFVVADYLQHGQLSHRNRSIYEALLANYKGDYLKVMRHIQVERFFVSNRYREGYVTVEPQLSVDATERQITQDNSMTALPAALQSLTLYQYGGELVMGNRGLIEYSDLLKRPLEAFKYLLTTVEQSSVSLSSATLFLDLCFIGTSNEIHLSAFKEIPEFQSFKGRVELVRVPYLLDVSKEEKVYEAKLAEAARTKFVAPHCAYVAALWAVATRMRKPQSDKYPSEVSDIIAALGPVQKAELYCDGSTPRELTAAEAKELGGHLSKLRLESHNYQSYEGLTGASPRELQSVIFNSANSANYDYVSPLQILEDIEELCKHVSVYQFLRQETLPGGFHDHKSLVEAVRSRLLARTHEEFRAAMGLVEDQEYQRVFERYVLHVTHYTRGEKMRNEATGASENADESMMSSVESTLGVGNDSGGAKEFRESLMAKIGAWSIDNPQQKPIYEEIFKSHFATLRDDYFREHEKTLEQALDHFLMYVSDGAQALNDADKAQAQRILSNLIEKFGYREDAARDIIRALVRERYS